jgi:hypothetical protein
MVVRLVATQGRKVICFFFGNVPGGFGHVGPLTGDGLFLGNRTCGGYRTDAAVLVRRVSNPAQHREALTQDYPATHQLGLLVPRHRIAICNGSSRASVLGSCLCVNGLNCFPVVVLLLSRLPGVRCLPPRHLAFAHDRSRSSTGGFWGGSLQCLGVAHLEQNPEQTWCGSCL